MRVIFRNSVLITAVFFLSVSSLFCQSNSNKQYAALQLSEESTLKDTLTQFSSRANSLWADKTSNLNFATDFLSIISRTQAEPYYKQASIYYFWSLKNASFDTQKEAIKQEVNRILPLVPDSTENKWRRYVKEENRQLFNEIAGFWQVNDPYSATAINERLIEHWERINYAQKHFDEASNTPYDTDDRGTFYVRFGPPGRIANTRLKLSSVMDPASGRMFTFELGNLINTGVEIWEYDFNNDGRVSSFLFGEQNGFGKYGLRKDPMELIDTSGLRVEMGGMNWADPSYMRRFSEKVAMLGVYSQLSLINDYYNKIYERIVNSIKQIRYEGLIERYLKSSFAVEGFVRMEYYEQIAKAPPSESSQIIENENVVLAAKTYSFLNAHNESEFLVSVKTNTEKEIKSYDSYFKSNNLFVYDKDWNLLKKVDELIKLTDRTATNAATYQISASILQGNDIYFSSELIDTTRNNIRLPGKVNSETSAIIGASGKQKLSFPEPLKDTDQFLISDIVLGQQQQTNFEARMPITPAVDYTFKEGADVMIYFEAYNVPDKGYTFTYYFKKDRWLLGHKKVNRSQVTVLADDVQERDNQLFSINLKDLEADSYQMVFEFTPRQQEGATEPKTIQRKIEIEIVE